MRYTLRQLEVFLAVAHHENVTRAADDLAMSQSACSGALKDLENQYEIQLFDRIGKRLQLNELGRLLRFKAEALLEAARNLDEELRNHRGVGVIKVGATLTIGNYLAVGLISQFMEDAPNASVTLEVANTRRIAEKILNFEIDIGLIEGEYHHPDLDIIAWQQDELVCFCSPQNPLAAKQALTDDDLAEARWILREAGSGTRQTFDRAMQGLLPRLHILLELQHTEAIKRAVESELGIACLSRISLLDAFRRGSLRPLSVPHRDFRRNFYIVLHKHKYRSAGILKWLELCELSQNQA